MLDRSVPSAASATAPTCSPSVQKNVYQHVAIVVDDPLWSAHDVMVRALNDMKHGASAQEALSWLLDLDPQAVNVLDAEQKNLAWPLMLKNYGQPEQEPWALALFDVLVSAGLNVNHAATPGQTLLWRTRQDLDLWLPMVERMIKAGADVQQVFEDDDGTTLLHHAARESNTLVDLLIAHGANVNVVDHSGNSPLMWAASHGQLASVQSLLAANADVHHRNALHQSLLHMAYLQDVPIVDALIQAGAPLNEPDQHGDTPLLSIVRARRDDLSGRITPWRNKVVARLLEAGADHALLTASTSAQPGGDNAVNLASSVSKLDLDLLHILAEAGADVDQVNVEGISARARLESRAQRSKEITPAHVRVLVDTAALRRTLTELSDGSAGTTRPTTSRFRPRL